MEQNREPEINPCICGKLVFTKEPRIYNGERIVSSVNGVENTGQPNAKE